MQPNGDKYEGEWLAGVKHGRGTQWVRRDGKLRKLYTGDWFNGKMHVCTCGLNAAAGRSHAHAWLNACPCRAGCGRVLL